MKRIFDFIVSFLTLLFFIPFGLAIVFFIIMDSGFPVFFRQTRIGRNGAEFRLYKFRSMSVLKSAEKGSFDAGDTMRVTKVGRILRKSKLDELPQLLNVLKGDMSIVGPRPEVEQWVRTYPARWALVHKLKPGITDNASIEFRNEEELLAESKSPLETYKDDILPRKLDLYEDYVKNHSLGIDLQIIFRTIKVVLHK